jgi:hypothetical protein
VAIPTIIGSEPTDQSTVTATLFDASGNRIPYGGALVDITTSLGERGPITDHGDGRYTAQLSSAQAGEALLRFSINGNLATATATVLVDDTTPPAPPVIETPEENATVRPLFVVEGAAEPYATVAVRAGADRVCLAHASDAGGWSCRAEVPLPEGSTELIATQADLAGNVSEDSIEVAITVLRDGPPAPLADRSNGVQFTGFSEPNTTVLIRDAESRALLCDTEATLASAGGQTGGLPGGQPGTEAPFVCVPPQAVAAETLVELLAVDPNGNVSPPTAITIGQPEISVLRDSIVRTESQQVVGAGFIPGELVTATLFSAPTIIGSQQANQAGEVVFDFMIPAGTEYGPHFVKLTSPLSEKVSDQFTLLPKLPTSTAVTPSYLGKTGAASGGLWGLAVLATLAGAVVLGLRRGGRRLR